MERKPPNIDFQKSRPEATEEKETFMTSKTLVTIALLCVFAFVTKNMPVYEISVEIFVSVFVVCLWLYYSYIRRQ